MEIFKTREDFLRTVYNIENKIQKLKNCRNLKNVPKEEVENRIFKGDYILLEGGASFCIIIVLFDKTKNMGCLLHCAGPQSIEKFVSKAILRMGKMGATKITTFIAGGSEEKGEKEAVANWEAVSKILSEYKIEAVKKLENIEVEFIAYKQW